TKTTKAKPTNTTRPARTTTVKKVATVRKATKPNSPASTLSPQQVGQVLELLKGANSIELKLSIPHASHRATIRAIGLDPVEAQPRQAFFFDTPDLALNRAGLVVRVRRTQGGTADT